MGAAFRLTFLRAIREPALCIAYGSAVLLLALAPAGTALGFEEQESLVRDIGLSTLLLAGIVVATVAGSVRAESGAAETLLLLRPVNRAALYGGMCAGALLAHAVAVVSLALVAFALLRHRTVAAADLPVLGMPGGLLVIACLWGAWRNYRRGTPFPQAAMAAAAVGSAGVACVAALVAPDRGGFRAELPSDDVFLIQTEVLCVGASVAAFAAVWTASVLAGRIGGIAIGWGVVIAGVVRETLTDVPAFLAQAMAVLIPNFGLLWGGDLFYADLVTLPGSYVAAGIGYVSAWSCAVLLVGLACFGIGSRRVRPGS